MIKYFSWIQSSWCTVSRIHCTSNMSPTVWRNWVDDDSNSVSNKGLEPFRISRLSTENYSTVSPGETITKLHTIPGVVLWFFFIGETFVLKVTRKCEYCPLCSSSSNRQQQCTLLPMHQRNHVIVQRLSSLLWIYIWGNSIKESSFQ